MNLKNMISKNANESQEQAWRCQSEAIVTAISAAIEAGDTVCVFDRIILPELGYQLVHAGYDVNVQFNDIGIGKTVVSWWMTRKDGSSRLTVFGPEELQKQFLDQAEKYKSEFKEAQAQIQVPRPIE